MQKIITLLLVLFCTQAISQHICGFDEMVPFSERKAFGQQIIQHLTQETNHRSAVTDTFELVFHIIHLGTPIGVGSNLSDAQIESAVFSLNRDFGAWPIHDSISIAPNGVDSEIYFRLACLDPDGNPTNGINRVDGRSVPTFEVKGIDFKPMNTGNNRQVTALSDWDINRYINVWVVHRIETPNGSITGGGAFPPFSPFFVQGMGGVYMNYRYVGSDVDGSMGFQLFNKYGKLISHEVGHYLGLLHTFEGGSCMETDCLMEGDMICDTEPHDNSFSDDSTCNEFIECSTREPVENLMNYSGKTCGNIFTQGQKDRMKATIDGYLKSLVNPPGCDSMLTGIELGKEAPFRIYPNPTHDKLNIELNTPATISLLDLSGKQILKRKSKYEKNTLDVKRIPPAVYLLLIESGNSSYRSLVCICNQ